MCCFTLTEFSEFIGNCQSLPKFEHDRDNLSNNSYIYYPDIGDGGYALKCVTDSVNYCNNTDVGGWRDESGRPVYQGADGTPCLYVTRGDGVISLHRKKGCTDHTSGLRRCNIPDSSGKRQSLYIYIRNRMRNALMRALRTSQQYLDVMCFPVLFPTGKFGEFHP